MKPIAALFAVLLTFTNFATQAQEAKIIWTIPPGYSTAAPPPTRADAPPEQERIELELTGEKRVCLAAAAIQSTQVVDKQTILFRLYGGDFFVNTLSKPCPALQGVQRVGYAKRDFHELCAADMVTAFAGRGLGPVCPLSNFERAERVIPPAE